MFSQLYQFIFGPFILVVVLFFLYWLPLSALGHFLLRRTIQKTIFYYFLIFIPIAVWFFMNILVSFINLPFGKSFGNMFYEPILLGLCVSFFVRFSLRTNNSFDKDWFTKNIFYAVLLSLILFFIFPKIGNGV